MDKRTKLVFLLVSVLLSLVYIGLVYFGIIRYVKMHCTDPEKFIAGYSALDRADTDNRVVITLEIPAREIDKIEPLMNSILDQTVKVDEIAIHIYVEDDQEIAIPKYLKKIARIYMVKKSHGQGNAIIPTIMREKDGNTIIMHLDHMQIFGKDFIEDFLTDVKDGAVSAKGAMLIRPNMFTTKDLYDFNTKNAHRFGMWEAEKLIDKGIAIKNKSYRENYTTWRSRKRVNIQRNVRFATA